jgi:hypothetical protein
MSVTLINIFEVPAGDEAEFLAAWQKTRNYPKELPSHLETALHESLHDGRFRFVNVAQWTSEEDLGAAIFDRDDLPVLGADRRDARGRPARWLPTRARAA